MHVIRKLVLTGGARERELQLVGRIVGGRDPGCEISHDDSLLSRRHAEFIVVDDTVTVRDLGSRNGVYVNGARALEQVLTPGDVIQIGPLRAQFVVEDASLRVTAEDAEADRTGVIRKVFSAVQVDAAGSIGAGVATVDDSDEVTRMVPAPRLPSIEKPMPNDYAARMLIDDDAPTQYVSREAVAPALPVTSPSSGSHLSIVVPVMSLAMVVLASTAIPLLLNAPTAWLALPVMIAVAGSYLVASSIHRRMLEATGAGDRQGT
jgi:pSer/pThr/pTyr-binding forkhead associated (FHA) protein